MKKSYDQIFRLTTNLVALENPLQACNLQSALIPVRSVECGLLA